MPIHDTIKKIFRLGAVALVKLFWVLKTLFIFINAAAPFTFTESLKNKTGGHTYVSQLIVISSCMGHFSGMWISNSI